MSQKAEAPDIAVGEVLRTYPRPALLNFQPTTFMLVPAPELPAWEELLKRKVGLKPLPKDFGKNVFKDEDGGTRCESGDTNDCDQE